MRNRLRVSVRARTTIIATAIVALATTAVSFLLVGYLHTRLTEELDEALRSRLATASHTQVEPAQALPSHGVAIELRRTDSAATVQEAEAAQPTTDTTGMRSVVATVATPDGSETLIASASTHSVTEATNAATRALLIGAPILLALVAMLTWFSTGRALRPVDAIREEFARLSARDLRGRMPVPAGNDALARLASTLNETLDRLDVSVRRQRQFVADASHELRSPLTALRTPLEVARAHPDRANWPELTSGTLQDLDRLEQLVADLLALAKVDALTDSAAEQVDLSELLTGVLERRMPGDQACDTDIVDGIVVRGQPTHLARLVTNLLDNAERYAEERITVRLSQEDGHACIEVADDGPGVPEDARELVFERFTRLDTARERPEGGAGLGLALARGIATMHGGTLHLLDSAGGARFLARIPLAGDIP
ncbi:signal transduction histidine kinase [Tamaricihabitans halophyticus]|uniref:histidine kinase n=1 Tax=Tamaricihabitans halophyticus TaxID=1262583 RepID=A0A4R2QW02_9PSEU|nr:ATP-binding protein [Tamaricihabitans halophyticus]TCP53078.1 signal transduction histidine kinase [Tamaricihabitans halophyticus]